MPGETHIAATPNIRKLVRLGHSRALTIPAKWLRTHNPTGSQYVTVTVAADGTLEIRPFIAAQPAGT